MCSNIGQDLHMKRVAESRRSFYSDWILGPGWKGAGWDELKLTLASPLSILFLRKHHPWSPGTGDTNLLLKCCFAPLVLTRSCCQKIVRSIVQSLNLELILTVLVKIVQPPWKYRCILPEKKTSISRFPARFCSLLIFVGQPPPNYKPISSRNVSSS